MSVRVCAWLPCFVWVGCLALKQGSMTQLLQCLGGPETSALRHLRAESRHREAIGLQYQTTSRFTCSAELGVLGRLGARGMLLGTCI